MILLSSILANCTANRSDGVLVMECWCDGQLKLYSSVVATEVEWLWYPFIPFGKLTLIQGDPGCGKSTLALNLISALSNGESMPDGKRLKKPINCIYQCSEDSVADTIKPRLIAAGADCNKVAFIDEDVQRITIGDEKIRKAIADFHAKLLVIDPVQAYLGDNDISSITGMRKILKQLSYWAEEYECAVVLIGHLNKRQGVKDVYRGLGSVDLIATARSVIQIEGIESDENAGVLHHVKSSLAAKGMDRFFVIDSDSRFRWLEEDEICGRQKEPIQKKSKQKKAVDLMYSLLAEGPKKASEVEFRVLQETISKKTLALAKKQAGIRSIKKDGVWYWQLPGTDNDREEA